MSTRDTAPENATEAEERAAVIAFLGGARGIGARAESLLDLHDRMAKGFPLRALRRFEKRCPQLVQDNAFARVLGLPAAGNRSRRLTSLQSGQLWRLASLIVTAAPVFGGTEATEGWMLKPALGLGGRRPLDLMETPMGRQLVVDHLIRVAYGVYI